MKLKANTLKITYDLEHNMTLSVSVDRKSQKATKELYDELKDKLLSIELKEYRKPRSIDANAYLWVLCGKLAAKLGITKEEVYRREIQNLGIYDVLKMPHYVYTSFAEKWRTRGVGWFCEILDILNDGKDVYAAIYYGSSSYNSAEMKRIIDGLIYECKEQGIQTETPDQIALMLERWKSVTA